VEVHEHRGLGRAGPGGVKQESMLRQACAVILLAQGTLDAAVQAGSEIDAWYRIVDTAGERLARLSVDDSCDRSTGLILLDWRDRLSSHVLAARALADIQVHADVEIHMLERGLVEVASALDELAGDPLEPVGGQRLQGPR
jgi:hypothetical protein